MDSNDQQLSSLWRLVSNHVWIGAVMILVAIILDQHGDNRGILFAVLVESLRSVGLAIVVGSAFGAVVNNTLFMRNVLAQLRTIVTGREFLRTLSEDAKRVLLREVLQSHDSPVERPEGETYLNNYIDKALLASTGCVRSNCHTECRVSYSRELKRLLAQYVAIYRLYPSDDGSYENIRFGRLGERKEQLEVVYEYARVSLPNGDVKEFHVGVDAQDEGGDYEITITEDGDQYIEIPIAKIGKGQPHLDITLRMWEYGNDHWMTVGLQAMQPTDGFRFSVLCRHPLEIRNEQVFVYGATRTKYPRQIVGKREATISCQQWIEKGSGVTMIIGVAHDICSAIHKELAQMEQVSNAPCKELSKHVGS